MTRHQTVYHLKIAVDTQMPNDRSVASPYFKKHIVRNIIYAQLCAFVTHEKGKMKIIRLQYAALNINKLKIIPLFRREQQKND